MEYPFSLPGLIDGKELFFQTRFTRSANSSQYHVAVNKVSIVFEPDDATEFRTLNYNQHSASVEKLLLEAIIVSLKAITTP